MFSSEKFFITKDDITNVLNEMEKDGVFKDLYDRRKKYILYLLGGLLLSILLFYLRQNLVIYIFFIYIVFFGVIISNFSKGFKKLFSSKYASLLSEKINYSTGGDLFPISLSSFYNKSGILNYYEGVDFEEDSISIKTDSFNLYGEEIQTYKTTTDDEGRTSRSVTNHAYILYVEILKHRFPIKNYVRLAPDINDSIFGKILYYILASGFIFVGIIFLVALIGLDKLSAFLRFIIGIFSFLIGILIVNKFIRKNRVILENENFEKIFDVYSENEIEARRLLTPKLMERLVELVKKSRHKGWTIKFVSNKIYAKFDVGNFLEVGLFSSNVKKQVENFLYQIKYIVDFINYLNIEYFSEVEFLKEKKFN